MAQRCPLCLDTSGTFVSKKAVIDHLANSHRIENPKESLELINMYIQEKIFNTSCHWRCLKFSCEKCRFTTHLKSLMLKHRRRSGHGNTHLRTLQMKVVLRRSAPARNSPDENTGTENTSLQNLLFMSAPVKKSPDNSASPLKQFYDSAPFQNQQVAVDSAPFQNSTHLPTSLSFGPGNLVNARMRGYPTWPGLIFHEASSGRFYDSTEDMYYIKFFDAKNTTSGWVDFSQVTPFDPEIIMEQTISASCKLMNPISLQYRLKKAIEWAKYASGEDWTDEERLDYFQDKKK